jgi:hypothetical protein
MKMDNKYSRRAFIGKYFYSNSVLLGGAFLLGCTSLNSVANNISEPNTDDTKAGQDTIKSSQAQTKHAAEQIEQKNPCDDLTGVSAEEIEKRKKLAYVNKTPIPDSHCSNCTLYIPPGKDKPCGGCMLFKGPVRPEGYCAYWAPITS